MIRALIAAVVCVAGAPALAQTPVVAQVDAAAIYQFDPDGGAGAPLTKEIIRAYLATPITRPTDEQYRSAGARSRPTS